MGKGFPENSKDKGQYKEKLLLVWAIAKATPRYGEVEGVLPDTGGSGRRPMRDSPSQALITFLAL